MDEENLDNNQHRPIVRIGDTIHRPAYYWTPAVHSLLRYLESVGFRYSPRVLGFDEQGREVLSYIAGDSGVHGWAKITAEDGLRKFAHLLREYHEAIAGFKPEPTAEWACSIGEPKAGEIMCHGDFGPWNIIWRDSEPVGIVDWDLVMPAPTRFDVLYALEYSAPFRDDKTTLEWHHFAELPDRKHRIDIFLEAYGMSRDELGDTVSGVAALQRTVAGYEKLLAERGLQPQLDWVANGDLEVIEKRAQWTEANRYLFEESLK